MTFEDYVSEHLTSANLTHKALELVRTGWNDRGKYGQEAPESLEQILKGIDQRETDSPDGWWETSAGAEFGARKLAEIKGAIAAREQGGEAVAVGRITCEDPDFYYGEGRYVLKAEFSSWLDKGTKLYTHPQPTQQGSVPEWIRCSERAPGLSDGDERCSLWVSGLYENTGNRFVMMTFVGEAIDLSSKGAIDYFMPTGLKRPTPPEEGDE